MITNFGDHFDSSGTLNFSISDHDGIFVEFSGRQRPNSPIKCVKRNLSFLRDPYQELNLLFYDL